MNRNELPHLWQPSRRTFLKAALSAAGALSTAGLLSGCTSGVDPT